jgi:hypothetical protein
VFNEGHGRELWHADNDLSGSGGGGSDSSDNGNDPAQATGRVMDARHRTPGRP